MLDLTPDPVALQIGPFPIYWYGIGYAVGLALAYLLLVRLAKRSGEDPEVVGNGIIIVAVAALIGGRLYHVIDQWALYQDDPISIVLPPYTGLGVYGGIITGTIAAFLYARYKRVPFLRWADIVAPGLFVMQAVARWGNFFNQELYGTPTSLPWGIPIDCAHRVAAYPCAEFPEATTAFHPLFLYESISGILGALVLIWLGYHRRDRLRPGDLLLIFFIWYGTVRFFLEPLRQENWTFNGIPTAMLVSLGFIAVGVIALLWRHRPGHDTDAPATQWRHATWGALGAIPEGADAEDEEYDDDDDEYDDDEEGGGRYRGRRGRGGRSAGRARTADLIWRRRQLPGAVVRRPRASRRKPSPMHTVARARDWRGSGARPNHEHPCWCGRCACWPGSCASACSASRSRPRARSTCRLAATCSWAQHTAAGWTRSSSCTPSPSSPERGSLAARHPPSHRAVASGSCTRWVGSCRCGAVA